VAIVVVISTSPELVDLFNDGNANEKSGTTASISKHAHGPHVRVAPKVDARVR
jgi:hypothetical protein